ncbi:hypothetical protein JCM8202v2_005841 [Rhodotorula sphaerocarpa]
MALPALPPPPAQAIAWLRSSSQGHRPVYQLTRHGKSRAGVREWSSSDFTPASEDPDSEPEKEKAWEDVSEPDKAGSAGSDEREGTETRSDGPPAAGGRQQLVLLSEHPALVRGTTRLHSGVLVAKRQRKADGSEVVFLERMPLATRVGVRLLYHGVDRGRRFDNPAHALREILHFIRTYRIDCSELAQPDLLKYPTLNSFFYRKLRPDARPVARPGDPSVISSAADCRLTVFRSVASAHRLWIKGRRFSLSSLLRDQKLANELQDGPVAVFRLAPADYHRFHAPVSGTMGSTTAIPGEYYTVNSLIVRDERFDVFTANKRDVSIIHCANPATGQPAKVAYVQVGALLVASILQTTRQGQRLERGDEMGYFAYGGSTIVAVFPPGNVEWDAVLLANSEGRNARRIQVETKIKVGEAIGRWISPNAPEL